MRRSGSAAHQWGRGEHPRRGQEPTGAMRKGRNLMEEASNKKSIRNIFWELMALRYIMVFVVCFSLYHLLEPFIALWVGREYILDKTILVFFILPVSKLKEKYGFTAARLIEFIKAD